MKTPLNELLDFLDTQEGVPNIRVLVNQLGLLEKEKNEIINAFINGTHRVLLEEDLDANAYFDAKFGKDGMHT